MDDVNLTEAAIEECARRIENDPVLVQMILTATAEPIGTFTLAEFEAWLDQPKPLAAYLWR